MTGPDIDRDGTRSLPLAGSNNAAARAGVLEVPPTPWVQPEARRRDELAYDRPCHGSLAHGPMTGPVIDRDASQKRVVFPLQGEVRYHA